MESTQNLKVQKITEAILEGAPVRRAISGLVEEISEFPDEVYDNIEDFVNGVDSYFKNLDYKTELQGVENSEYSTTFDCTSFSYEIGDDMLIIDIAGVIHESGGDLDVDTCAQFDLDYEFRRTYGKLAPSLLDIWDDLWEIVYQDSEEEE